MVALFNKPHDNRGLMVWKCAILYYLYHTAAVNITLNKVNLNFSHLFLQIGSRMTLAEKVRETCQTNFYATLDACEVLFPILKPHAR